MLHVIKTSLLLAWLIFCGLIMHAEARLYQDPIDIIENQHFYVGAGVGYSIYSLKAELQEKIQPNKGGHLQRRSADVFTPFFGIRFRQKYSISLEAGYIFHQPLGIHPASGAEGRLTVRNHYADFMIHLPLLVTLQGVRFDIPIGIGIGHVMIQEKESRLGIMGPQSSYSKYGLRGKIGIEYNFDDHLAVRFLAKYQKVGNRSGMEAIDSFKSVGTDVVWAI